MIVELTRLELATSCMPCRRAPNCAITPFAITKVTYTILRRFSRTFYIGAKSLFFWYTMKVSESEPQATLERYLSCMRDA